MRRREKQLRRQLDRQRERTSAGSPAKTTFDERWKGVSDWSEGYRKPMKTPESNHGLKSTSSIKVTMKAPPKSKPTFDDADEERVSASMKAAEVDDLPPSPKLQVDLNASVSDEEKPIESEKDGVVDVDISEATRSLKLDDSADETKAATRDDSAAMETIATTRVVETTMAKQEEA